MNLRSLKNNVAAAKENVVAALGLFRQIRPRGVMSSTLMIPMSVRYWFFALSLGWACLAALLPNASAQTNYYTANGTEYPIIGSLPYTSPSCGPLELG